MNKRSIEPVNMRGKPNNGKKKMRLTRILGLCALVLTTFFILVVDLLPEQVSLSAGEIASEDVFYSGATTTYVSDIQTEAQKNEAASSVGQVFVIDDTVTEELLNQINSYAESILRIENSVGTDDLATETLLAELQAALPGEYTDEVLLAVLSLEEGDLLSLFQQFKELVKSVYDQGVTSDETVAASQSIALAVNAATITDDQESFLKSLLQGMVLPYNEEYDAVATRALQDEAIASVSSVIVKIQSGQKLVSRGAVVTDEQIEALQALGMYTENASYNAYLGLLVLVVLLYVLLYYYLRFYQTKIYDSRSTMLLLSMVMTIFLFLAKLLSLIQFSPSGEVSALIGYLLPIPAAAMLLAVLLDRNTAIFCTAVLSVFVGVIMDGELSYVLVALAGGITGILTTARLNQRSQFVSASVWITLVNLVMIGSWGLIRSESYSMIALGALFGLINGLLSAILAMGVLPFLEGMFGITTGIRLLELSNSNHPLLKRLMIEAPGSYNHSILVGNLAEAAADAIGANALLVRVSSYYHDIGKLKRPQFYIENQRPGENPHDKLQPALSAMIITAHPSDGAKVLRDFGFPAEIVDIVEQHHGNSLLRYFYHKAKELAEDPDSVKEEDFRYKGEKPQTREAALVMLADSVQAAVQALKSTDKDALETRVREVIDNKLHEDDQLQDSPLTLRELEMIVQSFLMVLSGINHIRITYPDQQDKAIEQALEDDTQNARILDDPTRK